MQITTAHRKSRLPQCGPRPGRPDHVPPFYCRRSHLFGFSMFFCAFRWSQRCRSPLGRRPHLDINTIAHLSVMPRPCACLYLPQANSGTEGFGSTVFLRRVGSSDGFSCPLPCPLPATSGLWSFPRPMALQARAAPSKSLYYYSYY